MMAFLSIVVAIVFLGFLIFIHEWSHFIIARKGGVKVPVFSIGFGP
ncbi:site-2 protease family protein, partial [candidate division WOR-3 bacterium]|nr:site-2 protease family protein [candidate division WOR-3 bacterium]